MYHYTYKITLLEPTDERKYYIGVRTSKVLPELDDYCGSCIPLNEWIKDHGKSKVKKEILANFFDRNSSIEHEIELHNEYDVAKNPEYWNRSKQTSSKFFFDSTGIKRGPLSKEHKETLSKKRKGVSRGNHKPETIVKQKGVEYHCPVTKVTKRIKLHLGETPPPGWVKGRHINNKRKWITNGSSNKIIYESDNIPKNWYNGRTRIRNEKGQFK